MRFRYTIPAVVIALSACGTVVNEKRTTAALPDGYYAGEPYEIVTQLVQGEKGTYERTRVVYWGRTAPCIANSPGDCEAAARRLIDHRFTVGLF